jgi:beta-lactamase superfamily II metal-dependent hydrolase
MKKYVLVIVSLAVVAFVSCTNPAGNGNSVKPLNHTFIESEGLSVHFLELGNQFTGDSVFIDYGDTEIIIDSGSRFDSAETIRNYIDQYTDDEKLEFVIATHAHEDHISAFADHSYNKNKGILSSYEIGTIIDFTKTNTTLTTSTYTHYIESRNAAVEKGAVHYTALQCYRGLDGAKRIYQLSQNVSLEILYNYYYDNKSPDNDENHNSVCVMIHNGDQQYLFTGDMEKEGEEKLVEYYTANHGGLGHCALFKSAHHGSNTSNTETLLNEITPEYVCICTCCGSSEYTDNKSGQFPTENTINHIAKHTEKVFVTTLVTDFSEDDAEAKYESMNGNIVFAVKSDGAITLTGSNNSTPLKDTEWFAENRTMPKEWE